MRQPKYSKVSLYDIAGPHPLLEDLMRSLSENIYPCSLDAFSARAAAVLEIIHPIVLSRSNNKLFVIGGFRTWQLKLSENAEISDVPALVFSELEDSKLREWAAVDILGSALLMGLGSKPREQIHRLAALVDKESLVHIHPDLTSGRGIARLLRGAV
jgi:hypothetical protein